MTLVESAMLELGTCATDFELLEPLTGKLHSLAQCRGEKGTLVMFLCNHCPYVKHIESALIQLGRDLTKESLGLVAISSNDVEQYPEDGPIQIAQTALAHGYPFPYLFDQSQEIALAYQVACTPDFFLFDAMDKLVYRGRFDNATPDNTYPPSGRDLRHACTALVTGKPVSLQQLPSVGCSIKWKLNSA